MKEKYYVYTWSNPKTNEIFYVGKGKTTLHYDRSKNIHHSGRCQNKMNKLISEGYTYDEIVNIVRYFNIEQDALNYETSLIQKYGILEEGGTLFNFRKDGTASGSYQKYRDRDIKDMIKAYESGMTLLEISKDYNIHETTVRKYLNQAGIKLRAQGYTVPYPPDWNEKVSLINKKKLKITEAMAEWSFSYPTLQRLRKQATIYGFDTID